MTTFEPDACQRAKGGENKLEPVRMNQVTESVRRFDVHRYAARTDRHFDIRDLRGD